jgi:hypothetical protein
MQTFMLRRSMALLVATLLILALTAGCGKPAPPASSPDPAAGAGSEPSPPTPAATADPASPAGPVPPPANAQADPSAGVAAATLFPARDWGLEFQVLDLEPGTTSQPREHLLRDGNRVVAVYDGRPYATWLIDETGVWRADPQNPGTLLRYLPPVLSEGATWTQESGGEIVWFQLTREPGGPCLVGGASSLPEEQCWTLTVLNRDELTVFNFAPGLGPTTARSESRTKPDRSFYKEITANEAAAGVTATQRSAWLRAAPGAAGARAPVAEARAEAFAEARDRVLGVTTVRGDLNGDGTDETIRGVFGAWTTFGLTITDANGKAMADARAYRATHKVDPVRFRGSSRLFLLRFVGEPGSTGYVTLIDATMNGSEWWVYGTCCWDPKAYGTPATRVSLTEDGLVTVEWDMGDPARHTRVRQYRFLYNDERPHPERLSQTFRPQGAALVHPTEPLQVLEAAFVARWMGLDDELPRYFASTDAARAFAEDKRISEPSYGPGQVDLATVTEQKPGCNLTKAPAQPGADGSLPFLATWGGYEWFAAVWGTARMGRNPQGLPVIEAITFEGDCSGGD